MELKTFGDTAVIEALNTRFVSFRIQLDGSPKKKSATDKNYKLTEYFRETYQVNSYPTLMVFSSSGDLISKELGYMDTKTFLAFLTRACDLSTFYDEYITGSLAPESLPKVINLAKRANSGLVDKLVAEYFDYILHSQSNVLQFSRKNLDFLSEYCKPENKDIYDFFYTNQSLVDSVYEQPGKAKKLLQVGYQYGEIYGALFKGVGSRPNLYVEETDRPISLNPNWNKISEAFQNKFPDLYDKQIIADSQIVFYEFTKQWNLYAIYWLKKMESINISELQDCATLNFAINDPLYNNIFKFVNDKKLLLRAADLSLKLVNNMHMKKCYSNSQEQLDFSIANRIDTYANLLYKAGKIVQARDWEKKSVDLTHNRNEEFRINLQKMREGQPTW